MEIKTTNQKVTCIRLVKISICVMHMYSSLTYTLLSQMENTSKQKKAYSVKVMESIPLVKDLVTMDTGLGTR